MCALEFAACVLLAACVNVHAARACACGGGGGGGRGGGREGGWGCGGACRVCVCATA